jgi:hypothetical protein
MNRRTFHGLIAAAIVSALGLQLFWIYQGLYSISWDDSGRTLSAYDFVHNYKLFFGVWLPFYKVVVGLGLSLFPDLLVTPRIVTLVFGMATVIALSWLSHILFNDKKVTVITAFLSAYFSQRMVISIAPLSSIMFDFVLLMAVIFFMKWQKNKGRVSLILCAAFFAMSGTVRYEGWIFSGLFILMLLFYTYISKEAPCDKEKIFLLVPIALVLAFPLLWCALWFYLHRNPFGFLGPGATYFPSILTVIQKSPLVEFVSKNIYCLNLIGIIPLFHYCKKVKIIRALAVLIFVPLMIISAELILAHKAQSGPSWRDIVAWSLFLIPFNAVMICKMLKSQFLMALAVMTFAVVNQMDVYRIREESRGVFPKYEISAGNYLKEFLIAKDDTRIYIECSNFQCLNIIAASQHPDNFIWGQEAQSNRLFADPQSHKREMEKHNIRMLILENPSYKEYSSHCENLTRMRDFGRWTIYAVP